MAKSRATANVGGSSKVVHLRNRNQAEVGHAAAARSSLSARRMTILRASSGSGRCSALASSPRRAHPHVALLIGRQDHRHCLGMDRLDDDVRCRRQKAVDLMRPWHRLRLRAAITVERRPDASESEQRSVIVQGEPDDILLLRLRVWLRRVLGEAVGRDQAAVLRLQPAAPVRL